MITLVPNAAPYGYLHRARCECGWSSAYHFIDAARWSGDQHVARRHPVLGPSLTDEQRRARPQIHIVKGATQPMAKSPYSDGHIDGFADATNGKSQDARGRWIKWHGTRAESDWPDYRDGYNASYGQVSKAERAYQARNTTRVA